MKTNDVITNERLGETPTLLVSAKDTGGACNKYEIVLPPHPHGPLGYFSAHSLRVRRLRVP